MKIKYFLMAVLLPMALLCSCTDDPEKIKEDSTDMLALAESLLGEKEQTAISLMEDAHLKSDGTNTYSKDKSNTYITIEVIGGIVKSVELGKEHASKSDAMVTEKVWSKYTEKEALNPVAIWTGMIVAEDSTIYLAGSMMTMVQQLLTQFGAMIPSDVLNELNEAMERDDKSFQLALFETDPESVKTIEEVSYKTEEEINLNTIMNLVQDDLKVESATCRMEGVADGKKTYRVTYTHAIDQEISMDELF